MALDWLKEGNQFDNDPQDGETDAFGRRKHTDKYVGFQDPDAQDRVAAQWERQGRGMNEIADFGVPPSAEKTSLIFTIDSSPLEPRILRLRFGKKE